MNIDELVTNLPKIMEEISRHRIEKYERPLEGGMTFSIELTDIHDTHSFSNLRVYDSAKGVAIFQIRLALWYIGKKNEYTDDEKARRLDRIITESKWKGERETAQKLLKKIRKGKFASSEFLVGNSPFEVHKVKEWFNAWINTYEKAKSLAIGKHLHYIASKGGYYKFRHKIESGILKNKYYEWEDTLGWGIWMGDILEDKSKKIKRINLITAGSQSEVEEVFKSLRKKFRIWDYFGEFFSWLDIKTHGPKPSQTAKWVLKWIVFAIMFTPLIFIWERLALGQWILVIIAITVVIFLMFWAREFD